MLKKQYRLSDFKKLKSKTINSPLFTLKYLESGEKVSKFAFIISKKIDKRAVVRNKIKRQLSKSIENILEKIKTGYNFIFIARKEILGKNQKEIETEVEKIFPEKLKL